MKKILAIALFLWMISAYSSVSAQEPAAVEPPVVERETGWKKAGDEIIEAAHAVGDATADYSRKVWQSTKEGSVEVWDATKDGSQEAWNATKKSIQEAWKATRDGSQEAWEKSKAKIHDVTAPEPANTDEQ
ncbi:MAG TPA: hypothetical protein EYH19_05310 [Desulfocapsa sulfexigens]|nr:hypothetical protein [Desulfocapsa sulfexigens]